MSSNVALRTTAAEILNAAQPPTSCNLCQLVVRCIESHFLKALTAGSSTPLVIIFNHGDPEDHDFGAFSLVVSTLQTTYNMDSFVLNCMSEGRKPSMLGL